MRIAIRRILSATGAVALAMSLFTATAAFAQDMRDDTGLTSTANEAGFITQAQPLTALAGNLIAGALSLLGAVFTGLIIWGGFIWMTAQGEKDKISKAKNVITSAIIGLVIIFASYAIADLVIQALTTAETQQSL